MKYGSICSLVVGLVFLPRIYGQPQTYADSLPGNDVGEKANAAFDACRPASGACVVKLTPAQTYTFTTTIRIPPADAILDCSGSILQYQGTGDAVLVAPGPSQPPFLSGGIRDCTILGNASPRANGIHQQSRVGFSYDQVAVRNFTGAGSAGIWWENVAGSSTAPGWNEQDVVRKADIGNSTKAFRMSRSSGTDSFEYNRIEDLHMDVMDGQTGLSVEGTGAPGSASLMHGEISVRANVNAATQAAKVIAVTNGARIIASALNVWAEQTSGSAASYGLYVDASSTVYASGDYAVANLKTFHGGPAGSVVMLPTLNPTTGSIHYERAGDAIQQRHCKFDLGPVDATFWLASYGGNEVNCDFALVARSTDNEHPDVDAQGTGSAPVNVLYADGKAKAVGIGPGFSNTAPPKATLSVSGSTQLGSNGTPIAKLARYDAILSPIPVAANTCASETFPVPGIEAHDVVVAVNKSVQQPGLALGGFSVPSAGQVDLNFCNVGPRAITPAAGEIYTIVVVR
jgi:hypothetical protein